MRNCKNLSSKLKMAKTNYLICSGEACPLRMTCQRHQEWLNNEDEDADEMEPAYNSKTGACERYDIKEFYGG